VSNLFGEEGNVQFNRVFRREKVRILTGGRKEFVEAGMSFCVRGSGLRGVRMSKQVVVPPEVMSKAEEIIK